MSMPVNAILIEELRREAAVTRRLLERVPEEHFAWKPHARSMTLGQLAQHIAVLPGAITQLVAALDVEVPNVPLPEARDRAALLRSFDQSVDDAAGRLSAWSEADLAAMWTLRRNGTPLMEVSRGQVLRSILLNHTYHHRGQLTVYLRLLDVPLPPVYGPTADENPFV